jgi:cytochrome c-type biogenesis protein CcmH
MATHKEAYRKIFLILSLFIASMTSVFAAVDMYHFNNRAEEARYQKLLLEVRCAVCQNQSLIDSNTPLAEDLRREIYHMYVAGKTDEDIKAFLVERYGPNILYEPPVQANTLFLWLAPLFLVLLGVGIWVWRRDKK